CRSLRCGQTLSYFWSNRFSSVMMLAYSLTLQLSRLFRTNSLVAIQQFHPDVIVEKFSSQTDHVHLIIVIPPKYAVSAIIGKLKANTSREVRTRFPWLKKVYWRNEFWSVGFFSSTVGINEDVIKRYVEFQEKVDRGQVQLTFGF
ncbi:MAG: IS200/IS605 family transposase, partial [Candidatus Binatia bacterium]